MDSRNEAKNERINIYFDIICGITSSVLSLIGIFYVFLTHRITSIGWFTAGLIFWFGYLAFAFFLIGLGIIAWRREKSYNSSEPRKDLKAPIV